MALITNNCQYLRGLKKCSDNNYTSPVRKSILLFLDEVILSSVVATKRFVSKQVNRNFDAWKYQYRSSQIFVHVVEDWTRHSICNFFQSIYSRLWKRKKNTIKFKEIKTNRMVFNVLKGYCYFFQNSSVFRSSEQERANVSLFSDTVESQAGCLILAKKPCFRGFNSSVQSIVRSFTSDPLAVEIFEMTALRARSTYCLLKLPS